ncbi:hypothetical protein E4U34_002288 [Claviceps purpurea]|nr:hypothetical protein E4U34_002288 [Claviceps purpurea]
MPAVPQPSLASKSSLPFAEAGLHPRHSPSAPVYRQSHDQGIKPSQYLEIGSLFRWQSSSTNPSTTSPDDTSGWNSLLRFVILSNSMRLFCPSLDLTTAFGLSKSLVQCRFLDCGPAWIVRHYL